MSCFKQHKPKQFMCWFGTFNTLVQCHYILQQLIHLLFLYSKTCLKRTLSKRPKIGFQDQLSLNAGQKYCRMLQGEHYAILLTFNKLPFVIKTFDLSIFEWLFYTGFTVHSFEASTFYDSWSIYRSYIWLGPGTWILLKASNHLLIVKRQQNILPYCT